MKSILQRAPSVARIVALGMMSGLPAHAAEISWSFQEIPQADLGEAAPVAVVATAGSLHDAVNAGGVETTVNGVTFANGTGNIDRANSGWSVPNVAWGSNAGGFNTSDARALLNPNNSWINSAKYDGSTGVPGQLGMFHLIVGNQYQVQLFFADARTVYSINGRTVSVDGGATKTRYAFASSGGPYGYLAVTGMFIADAPTQSVNMQCYNPAGTPVGPQINAYQIRDLGLPSFTFAPTFTPGTGTYIGARTVTIESASPGATIHYTMDGSAPDESSASGPSGMTVGVPAGTTTTITAYAVRAGFDDSAVSSATITTEATVSGIWTNPAGGSWPDAANWLGNTVPYGGAADFGTLDLTADTSVALDGDHPVGNLIFGDNTPSHDWFLGAGSGGTLTLIPNPDKPSITVNNRSVTIDGVLAGAHGMRKFGAGELILSGANTYTGLTSLEEGSIVLTSPANHPGSIATTAGTTLEVVADTEVLAASSFNLTGDGTVVKTGAGLWMLGNAGRVGIQMSPGGLLDIQEGWISTGNHRESFTDNQGSINIAAGAKIDLPAENLWTDKLTGSGEIINSYAFSGGRTVFVGVAGGSSTFEGTIGSGSLLGLTKQGDGTQILTGAQSYTRPTVIGEGTLQIGNGGVSGSLDPGSAITTIGTLAFDRSDDISQGVHFSGSLIGGTGGLTQMGAGTLTLTANNTYTGTTLVTSGSSLAVGLPVGSTWTVADLALETGSTLQIRNFNADSAIPPVEATEILSASGDVTLKVTGHFEIGTFPLVYYSVDNGISGDGVSALHLILPPGIAGQLVNNEAIGSIDLEISEIVLSPFDQWMSDGYPDLAGEDALPGADPDNDGATNIVEFALMGDPTSGSDGGLAAMSTLDTNSNADKELVLTFAVRAGALFEGAPSPGATKDGVIYAVQGSMLLTDGFVAPVTELSPALAPAETGLPDIAGSGWEYHSFVLDGSDGLPGKGFLRVKLLAE